MTGVSSVVELEGLGFDGGAHVLLKLALSDLDAGAAVEVRGRHPELLHHLGIWCRQQGHTWRPTEGSQVELVGTIERGRAAGAAWIGAARAGGPTPDDMVAQPPADWGLAARGAAVERGGPMPRFGLDQRDVLWSDRAIDLAALGSAAQWNPATAIDWHVPIEHDERVERAVVSVMTFLVENEQAALVVPARFLGQVHPHFLEIQRMLAITVADEARHVEVFTRRATCTGLAMGLSTVGGRTSLQTLLDEPDYAVASFLLSVMGEGTFLSLLGFLERHAPDALTRRVAQLARNDEARHVAFAMAHLERHVALEPDLRSRLGRAVEQRHRALRQTAGLNEDVFDALVLLAAGSPDPVSIATGWQKVQTLQREMNDGRRARLARLGFTEAEAEHLASLHTRNFM
jgi:hypothetical protein